MARSLRDQRTNLLHHVMARGCRGQPIFHDEEDRIHFTTLLTEIVDEFEWTIYDWVLMPNHHHLLVGLKLPNLAQGMHRAHFMFGQRWNERHDSTGHVLFRRYKNVPLQRQGAAQRVMRYIDLNPVRAGLCSQPEDWEWAGYGAIIGTRTPLPFHAAHEALEVATPHLTDSDAARKDHARRVRDRLEASRRRGTPHDFRPSLEEILIPGDIDSVREATETWWYSHRSIAAHIGCSPTTIANWLADKTRSRSRYRLRAWAS